MPRNDRPVAESEPADVRQRRTEQPGGNGRGTPGRSGGAVVALLAVAIVGLLVWAVWATWFDDDSAGPELAATVDEVASATSEYVGESVVVSGQIDRILVGAGPDPGADGLTPEATSAAFILGEDDGVMVLGSDIPEVADLTGTESLAEGEVVQVAGTVRGYDVDLVQDTLGDVYDADAFAGFRGTEIAVIVADRIRLVPSGG